MANKKTEVTTFTVTLPLVAVIELAHRGGEYAISLADLSEETLAAALRHGLKQRINDRMAGGPDGVSWPRQGEEALTPREVADLMVKNLMEGGWKLTRTGGPRLSHFDAWLKAEATAEARKRIKKGSIKGMDKATPENVAKVVGAMLSTPAWVDKTQGRYVPPTDDIDDIEITIA